MPFLWLMYLYVSKEFLLLAKKNAIKLKLTVNVQAECQKTALLFRKRKQNILYWRVAIFGVCLHCCLGESWPPVHQTVVNICYQHIQPIVLITQVKTKMT